MPSNDHTRATTDSEAEADTVPRHDVTPTGGAASKQAEGHAEGRPEGQAEIQAEGQAEVRPDGRLAAEKTAGKSSGEGAGETGGAATPAAGTGPDHPGTGDAAKTVQFERVVPAKTPMPRTSTVSRPSRTPAGASGTSTAEKDAAPVPESAPVTESATPGAESAISVPESGTAVPESGTAGMKAGTADAGAEGAWGDVQVAGAEHEGARADDGPAGAEDRTAIAGSEAAGGEDGLAFSPYLPPATHPVRGIVWAMHLAVPLLGLWLLLAFPARLNARWEHPPSHFWLIVLVAGVNVVLGAMISQAATRHKDARLLLVSLVFLSSAGFFLLHGLSTPRIILETGSYGFDIGQPVGLMVASVLAFASSLPLGERAAAAVLRSGDLLRAALVVVLVVWGAASLIEGLTPLSAPPPPGGATIGAFSWIGAALFALSAVQMFRIHRRRPSAMLVSLMTAYALLSEAMVAGFFRPNWLLSWWEWHLLLVGAFAFVAYSSYIQFRREGSSQGLFDSVTLAATIRRIQGQYDQALEELVGHLRRMGESGTASRTPVALRLAGKFRLNEGQAAVLDRAGQALAAERELSLRLGALVDVGRQARVGLGEDTLLAEALGRVRQAYGDVRIGLVSHGAITLGERAYGVDEFKATETISGDGRVIHPLTVKGVVAGALEVPVGTTRQDEALAATLASQLSIALENARLYRELETLFRQYMSPDVAASLLADPDQAALGGSLVELTALFADLKGFTSFSERVAPGEIVEMLNRYHAAAVPCVLRHGGTIVQFVGDALLALFNAPAAQADHAAHAARAALEMQAAAEEIAAGNPGYPRFRIGINTGLALVGNIGSPELRGFNAMGDAVNVAARLEGMAEPGTVVIGATTREQIGAGAEVRSLGELSLKGKEQSVEAFVLSSLD
ncbi:adenylate/guanylate cyclase domain-containing protein [Sphaerisporangium sp. NPDC005288]|uniref:adenylate/guanylate cyclase domain-containing protein n=1 Tax=Sphaerisporangium sp. NPDC005288 TaxID=3155114 RepID=UPI0033A7575C